MLDPDHTPSERYAANELAGHVARITGAVLPVRVLDYDDLPSVGRAVLVGKGAWLDKRRFVESREALGVLGDDSVIVHTFEEAEPAVLAVAGGGPDGAMNAVVELLSRIGVGWYTPDNAGIPPLDTIDLGDIHFTDLT